MGSTMSYSEAIGRRPRTRGQLKAKDTSNDIPEEVTTERIELNKKAALRDEAVREEVMELRRRYQNERVDVYGVGDDKEREDEDEEMEGETKKREEGGKGRGRSVGSVEP